MTRDEILAEIKRLATPSGFTAETIEREVSYRLREVSRLVDEYPDHADADSLAEALADAMESFADMLL